MAVVTPRQCFTGVVPHCSHGCFQEAESRRQEEEEMGLKVGFEGSNRLNIPVKALSGR